MPPRPTRIALGRHPRRLRFERRVHLWLAGLALPGLVLTGLLTHEYTTSSTWTAAACAGFAFAWWIASSYFLDLLLRPLNTLSNVVAALREDDFSFRARGARRGDALGDLAHEINALASMLEHQRDTARDALTLVERVLAALPSPVLAFDDSGHLRLLNAAARTTFALPPDAAGSSAEALGLAALLAVPDGGLYAPGQATWSTRRAGFRLHGLPHWLYLLSDVSAALRREERTAWQRLIRVLSHEINNSLTPIQSIAGSLRSRVGSPDAAAISQLERGLGVIEERATSLNRFLAAYGRLSRMPEPTLRPTAVEPLVRRVVALETRLTALLHPGPATTLLCDPDQLEQALINLLRNAADAALAQTEQPPIVEVTWHLTADTLTFRIADNGLGLANPANLFVPFYTTKPEGTGIGLVLVGQIANSHGGSVTLGPNPAGPGCLAELTLPTTPRPHA